MTTAVTKEVSFARLCDLAVRAVQENAFAGPAHMQARFHRLLRRVAQHVGKTIKCRSVVRMLQRPELKALLVAHIAPVRLKGIEFLVGELVALACGGVERHLLGPCGGGQMKADPCDDTVRLHEIIKQVVDEELAHVVRIHPYPHIFDDPQTLDLDLAVLVRQLYADNKQELDQPLDFADPLHTLARGWAVCNDSKPLEVEKEFPQLHDVPVAAHKSQYKQAGDDPSYPALLMLRISCVGGRGGLVGGGARFNIMRYSDAVQKANMLRAQEVWDDMLMSAYEMESNERAAALMDQNAHTVDALLLKTDGVLLVGLDTVEALQTDIDQLQQEGFPCAQGYGEGAIPCCGSPCGQVLLWLLREVRETCGRLT